MPITLAANVVIAERFRLNRQLGRGGMGSVWHATHLGLDVPCAVKFIEGENAAMPEAHQRFEREAKAAAHLRSPHVVQILDHGVFQETPYIAMELLDGEDLGKRLQRMHRLQPPEVLKIVSQVCRALTKAHSVGIVHRDLKPDNIFLVRDDDREIAKVLDFGIAKATGAGSVEGSNTKTGAMLGTPYYMSPEQAQGTRAVDHRSDLWSLAVIVFQALTGKLPFESEALGDLLVKIIVSPVPVPSHIVQDLPRGFDTWWEKASQRDPNLRFSSARELSDGLGLVFGQSQGTDVMERPRGAGDSVIPPPGMMQTPNPRMASAPGFGRTPSGGGTVALGPHLAAMGSTPPPAISGATPQPAPTTGAPMSRTFAGGPGSAKSGKTALFLALGGGVLVVLVLGVVGISLAMKGKGTSATAATTTAVVTTVAPTDTPPPPPTAKLEPPPSADKASASASASGSSTVAIAPSKAPAWVAPPATPGKPPPAGSGKKKPVDLGI